MLQAYLDIKSLEEAAPARPAELAEPETPTDTILSSEWENL